MLPWSESYRCAHETRHDGNYASCIRIGLATVSAHAQGMGGGGHKHQKQTDKTEPQKSKADEKAYNAALKSVPNKPKPDPWQGTR